MRRMRWVILGLCMMICMTTEAFAAQQSGLNVRITSNKRQYGQTEVAEVIVAIENSLDHAVYNVEIKNKLPEELKNAMGSGTLFIERIPAQATVSKIFHIMKRGVILTIISDKECYEPDEIAELTIILANHGDRAIQNVEVASYLPDGLQYVRMEDNWALYFPQINVGESVTRRIRVKVMDPLPQKGDDTMKSMIVYIMLIIVSAILLIKCKRNKEIRQ